MELSNGLMVEYTSETTLKIKNTAMESLLGMMEEDMRVNGKMVNNMVLVNIPILRMLSDTVYGAKEKNKAGFSKKNMKMLLKQASSQKFKTKKLKMNNRNLDNKR